MTTYFEEKLQDRYDVGSACKIAESNYGAVFEVKDASTGQSYALKIAQTRSLNNSQTYPLDIIRDNKQAIKDEAEFLIHLNQSIQGALMERHILPVIAHGTWPLSSHNNDEIPAFVMPKADSSLNNIFGKEPAGDKHPFSPDDLIRWTRQIATALETVHSIQTDDNGTYIHRDLKPSNLVLLKSQGERNIFLIDFGVKKLRKNEMTGSACGTLSWMAPELAIPFEMQEIGKDSHGIAEYTSSYSYGPPADLFSLGLILYWLVTKGEYTTYQTEITRKFLHDNGSPSPNAKGMYGRLGGMTETDTDRLKNGLYELFGININTSTGTLIYSSTPCLPDFESVANTLFSLTEKLQSKNPTGRPTAKEIVEQAKIIGDLFKPEIKSIILTAPQQICCGETIDIGIAVDGTGIPESCDWLDIRLDGRKPEKSILNAYGHWTATFPEMDSDGQYTVSGHAIVNGEEIKAEPVTISVDITSQQLWDRGQYADALKKEPNRKEWLDYITGEAKGNPKKCCQWEEELQAVFLHLNREEQLPGYGDFKKVYFAIALCCEKGKEKADTTKTKFKKLVVFSAITVISVTAGIFYFLKPGIMPGDSQVTSKIIDISYKKNSSHEPEVYDIPNASHQVATVSDIRVGSGRNTLIINGETVDLDSLESITPQVAEVLANAGDGEFSLKELRKLSPEAAKYLGNSQLSCLLLGVEKMSPEVAKYLAAYKGDFILNGLKNVSPETATHLGNSKARALCLEGLEEMSPEVAKQIARYKGALSLGRFTKLSPEAAAHLGSSQALGIFLLGNEEFVQDVNLLGSVVISPELARHITPYKGYLGLNLLENISPEAATHLGNSQANSLDLSGLKKMSPEVARYLANYKGSLDLSGLENISPKAATHLGNSKASSLDLGWLKKMSPEIAKHLANYKGALTLNGVLGNLQEVLN